MSQSTVQKHLQQFNVSTFEELDNKDFGNYFLAKGISGHDMPPDEAAKSLYEKVALVDQYMAEMNRVRDEHRTATLKSMEKLRERKRNDRLFAVKAKSLVRKPEFKSRVADQYWLRRMLFSDTTFLEHGPLLAPWQKAAITTPDRVYEKNRKWVPNDDVT